MDIHKFKKWGDGGLVKTTCNQSIHALDNTASRYWSMVTCPECLKKKPLKRKRR